VHFSTWAISTSTATSATAIPATAHLRRASWHFMLQSTAMICND
jgi:hypothetical protein